MEKAYRTMKNSGAGSIVIGIIILVTGVAAGVISIVNGAHCKRAVPSREKEGAFYEGA